MPSLEDILFERRQAEKASQSQGVVLPQDIPKRRKKARKRKKDRKEREAQKSADKRDLESLLAERRAPGQLPDDGGPIQTAVDTAGAVIQGVSADFSDEMMGVMSALFWPGIGPQVGNTPGERFENIRNLTRQVDAKSAERSPTATTLGKIAGGVGSGLAAASAIPALAAGKGLASSVLAGAGQGAIQGLGSSEAELLEGDIGGAALDVAGGAVLGAGAGAIGQVIGKGAEKLLRSPTAKAADKVAGKVGQNLDDVSLIGGKMPVGKFIDEGSALEKRISKELGEDFRFSPAELTGDPATALSESAARQTGNMRTAQTARDSRLRMAAKFLDSKASAISANPDKLGRSNVGDDFVEAIKKYVKSLRDRRSSTAKELFDEVDQIAGSKKVIPVKNTRDIIRREIANQDSPAILKNSSELQTLIEQLDESPSLSGREMQLALADWGKKAAPNADPFKEIEKAEGKRIAKLIFGALKDDLDSAVVPSNAAAVAKALNKARVVYRNMSQEIDEAASDAIVKALRKEGIDSVDSIPAFIKSKSPDQIRGVFHVLNKADEEVADQLRAQMFDDMFTTKSVGKAARGAEISEELGVNLIKPGRALQSMVENEVKILAAFDGNARAKLAFKESMSLLQRLAFGPRLEGAQTAPLTMEILNQTMDTTGAVAGPKGNLAMRAFKALVNDNKSLASLTSTAKGMQAFRDSLRALNKPNKLTEKTATAIMSSINRLSINPAESEPFGRGPKQ